MNPEPKNIIELIKQGDKEALEKSIWKTEKVLSISPENTMLATRMRLIFIKMP